MFICMCNMKEFSGSKYEDRLPVTVRKKLTRRVFFFGNYEYIIENITFYIHIKIVF